MQLLLRKHLRYELFIVEFTISEIRDKLSYKSKEFLHFSSLQV